MNRPASGLRLTISGRQRLRAELDRLRIQIEGFEMRLKDELQHKDDLNWYVTYQELAGLRRRAAELEAALQGATGFSQPAVRGKVQIGSRVLVCDESGKEHAFVIVEPIETDPGKGYISFKSPVGAALFGRSPGDSVSVSIPRGERRFNLLSVA